MMHNYSTTGSIIWRRTGIRVLLIERCKVRTKEVCKPYPEQSVYGFGGVLPDICLLTHATEPDRDLLILPGRAKYKLQVECGA